jgi:hypothetical protein
MLRSLQQTQQRPSYFFRNILYNYSITEQGQNNLKHDKQLFVKPVRYNTMDNYPRNPFATQTGLAKEVTRHKEAEISDKADYRGKTFTNIT